MMKKIAVILSMLITVFIGFGLIIPVLPLMVKDVGARPYNLGLMLAVYSAVAFVMSPFWGRISDRVGRKPVLIIGLLGFAVSFLVFGLAKDILWLMYVARVIGGGFSGAVTATAMAYIADVTDEENRTKGMAFAGASIGMGFIIGPGVGGLLGNISIPTPFFVAAGLAVINAIWGVAALKESSTREERLARPKSTGSRWRAFAGALKYLYMVDFVAQFSIATLEGVFQYFEMSKFGATKTQIGMMFLISGLVGALVQGGIVQRYVKHGREVPAMYTGLVLSGIGMFLILFSTNFWTATLYMTIFGASNTVIKPTLTSIITKETTVGQGLANGLLSSMDSLARIIGPVLATVLFEIHHDIPFIVTGIIVIAAMALVMSYKKFSESRHTAVDNP
ncbi:MFS transporter [Alicyclobacillus sp. SO9]|uniref:MFS transporter n=1 Tax=Alicyclobacillus sp. SO9 TaxID=2665646 RepID=UPI0018E89D15|nr:MFS transporter [Alicyclobacillus sp. SO9]QQE80190.1 MFS transporter [Alicyclobacillus sp. SO9]